MKNFINKIKALFGGKPKKSGLKDSFRNVVVSAKTEDERKEFLIYAMSKHKTDQNAHAIILEEKNGNHQIPIVIGAADGYSISAILEESTPPSLLTHDLVKNIIETTGYKIKEVSIYGLIEGLFATKIILQKEEVLHEIDSRVGDALALAIRFEAPIYIYDVVVEKIKEKVNLAKK